MGNQGVFYFMNKTEIEKSFKFWWKNIGKVERLNKKECETFFVKGCLADLSASFNTNSEKIAYEAGLKIHLINCSRRLKGVNITIY